MARVTAARTRVTWLVAAAASVAAATSAGPGRRVDGELFRTLNAARGPVADRFFGFVTEAGSIWGSVGASIALAAAGHRRSALRALGAAGAMWTLGQVLKKTVLRDRPYDALPDQVRLLIARPRGTSWPSSHPAVLLSFVTVAARHLELPKDVRAALASVVAAVAASRVYLGVHYPSDVVGGVLLGRAVGLAWPLDERAARYS